MRHFIASLIACIAYANGYYLFITPSAEASSNSVNVFLLAVFIFLYNIPILLPFPREFRCIGPAGSFIFQLLAAIVLTELLLILFWQPLDAKLVAFIPTIPDLISEGINNLGLDVPVTSYLEIFKNEETILIADYGLAFFFLITIAHATKVIDLRLLRCGVGVFFNDIYKRLLKFLNMANLFCTNNSCSSRRGSNTECRVDSGTSLDSFLMFD